MSDATIRDVARAASVSVASASRALNGHSSVSVSLRERVAEAAARLRYVPHAGARSLSMARAHAIGVVLPDLHGEFFSELLRGMDRGASAAGFQLLLSNMHADPEQAARALAAMRGRVDGLLVMAPHVDPAFLEASIPVRSPAVFLNTAGDGERSSIGIDNDAGSHALVRHLVEHGRRLIVHVAGPRGNVDAEERRSGFLAAMGALGLAGEASVMEGDFDERSGAAAVQALLRGPGPPDAIYAANDAMAIGCLLALREAGAPVPDRVAVAGFDDIPAARYVSPALTTVRVDIAALGERAIAMLVRAMASRAGAERERVTPELVVRDSTLKQEGDKI